MRLRLGRPDLADYADRFTVPAATSETPVSVSWLGVSTLLIDDGDTAVMTDGFFSRPNLATVGLRTLSPSVDRIGRALARADVTELQAVVCCHTHFDHAMDSPVVAERTGAVLIGGPSAANVGRGHGMAEDRLVVPEPGRAVAVGDWDITLIGSEHCPPDRFPGAITGPLVPPVKASAYRCGDTWSVLVDHRPSGRRLLVQGSAGYLRGALDRHRAAVVYLGVGQLGLQPVDYLVEYWQQTVRAVGARRVVLIHWDDFFAPLEHQLRALPYAGDDLDVTMRVLGELADRDGVALDLPSLWRSEDPWVAGGATR